MPAHKDFPAVFAKLKAMLKPFEPRLVVEADTESGYSLNTPYLEKFGKPLFFGAAQIKKNYVSYYLMPVYVCPELLKGISPELRKRMQGKSCFNFSRFEPGLFEELAGLTRKGFDRFEQEFFPKSLPFGKS
jgi:hypothetical protein